MRWSSGPSASTGGGLNAGSVPCSVYLQRDLRAIALSSPRRTWSSGSRSLSPAPQSALSEQQPHQRLYCARAPIFVPAARSLSPTPRWAPTAVSSRGPSPERPQAGCAEASQASTAVHALTPRAWSGGAKVPVPAWPCKLEAPSSSPPQPRHVVPNLRLSEVFVPAEIPRFARRGGLHRLPTLPEVTDSEAADTARSQNQPDSESAGDEAYREVKQELEVRRQECDELRAQLLHQEAQAAAERDCNAQLRCQLLQLLQQQQREQKDGEEQLQRQEQKLRQFCLEHALRWQRPESRSPSKSSSSAGGGWRDSSSPVAPAIAEKERSQERLPKSPASRRVSTISTSSVSTQDTSSPASLSSHSDFACLASPGGISHSSCSTSREMHSSQMWPREEEAGSHLWDDVVVAPWARRIAPQREDVAIAAWARPLSGKRSRACQLEELRRELRSENQASA
eukprot:TRINITY_DN34015_c0_g2_i1.p1 TRINITY_DN34015_c0_g2~~TRINITY_DN34015_c0_g2_i1.p1  ORF type:complete len:453 (+),score=64.99 TRINITY_DN34015_c0_g2_i1:36-1394(+)